ncbi:MAG TPA: peptidase MA family metallohydrolase [Candidatus Hydrogenedentes bacterium]|nr:peptidase MA family metallohydrolase [Candidatus Hydrogenedentota bacterium]HQM47517.1 peptidase MA family metallohydrolase [Candidatus Hydrogenedentota bacterium]
MKWAVLMLMAAIMAAPARPCYSAVLQEGPFRVEYPKGEERAAWATMENLEDVVAVWGGRLAPGEAPVVVRICASGDEFAALAGFSPPPEVGGVAHSEDGLIVLRSPAQLSDPGYYAGMVRHELIHVLLARNTELRHLPRWLNEGIAMHISGEFRWNSSLHVARMYMADRLYSYDDLMLGFGSLEGERPFGDLYAQSLSMTAYLYDKMGEDAFWKLVYALREKDFPAALAEVAGVTPDELWDEWCGSLWKVAVISAVVSGFSVFQFMALLVVVAYIRKRRRNRRVLRRWEDEEEAEEPFMTVWELERDSEYPWERDEGEDG